MTPEGARAAARKIVNACPTHYPRADNVGVCGRCLDAIADAIARAAQGAPHKACPCLHTTPCDPRCTCVVSVSSRGCTRCCSYGNAEQQKAMAEHLAAQGAPPPVEEDNVRAQYEALRRGVAPPEPQARQPE